MKVSIDANFDPESKEDLEWVSGEMEKILDEVPEIKVLEDKLNLTKSTTDSLDAVISHLEKATDIIGMSKKKANSSKNASGNASANGTKKGNATNATKKTNATVAKAADSKATDKDAAPAAPAEDHAKALP